LLHFDDDKPETERGQSVSTGGGPSHFESTGGRPRLDRTRIPSPLDEARSLNDLISMLSQIFRPESEEDGLLDDLISTLSQIRESRETSKPQRD